MLKAVIVDDEIHSRELIRNLLKDQHPQIAIAGEAKDVPTAIQLIGEIQPDLVFLDIEIPGGNGFNILDALSPVSFQVIFVTGYDQYAIEAFKYSALDYVLKPIDPEDFGRAVNRMLALHPYSADGNIRFLQYQLSQQKDGFQKIALPGGNNVHIVDLQEVLYIEAEGNYTFFHLLGGQKKLASMPLSHYEEILPQDRFFRIHKSRMVNCELVIRIEEGRTGKAFLKDGSALNIAARRKKAFVDFYRNNNKQHP